MTFKTNCEIAKGPLDAAPMVSIVFLMLIYLVLSSPLVLQPGVGTIELPPAEPTNYSPQGLVVMIARDNLIFFNSKQTTLEQLPDQLRQAARELHTREIKNPELILKADRQVSYEIIVKITGLALDAGISAVNLATRPEVPVILEK